MNAYREKILGAIDRDMPPADIVLNGVKTRGDHDLNPDEWVEPSERKSLRLAAVLVPLIERGEGVFVLLTRRADHLNSHSGQVAFPGGKVEEGETAAQAALREAEEEVGLDPSLVEIAGFLDPYETGTGFRILPVVGFVKPDFTLKIDPNEVAEAFEVPLSFLMNPDHHERHSIMWRGKRRAYYAMPYEGHYIWGATAGMLKNMYDRVYAP
ncbi:NUDIX hydrolase [Tepidicaulis marinus]|uniref:NUDIX hydrolase n=1 Tax=Tepidicaulis marinus TaxID=1333998 RepID=A0A081BD13_9HYPH|nr:CoA pyrophosphatase [Tepidicaulis marinus]GAK45931.1 NUDIX hydrolase [Tepidicaulis marinus]